MALIKVSRGEIWAVDFEPQVHKAEPGKRYRPALVIQSNALNEESHPTTIVIPGTTNIRRDKDYFPIRVALVNLPGLRQETDLMVDQIRAISNARFLGEAPLARLGTNQLKRVAEALKWLSGL